MEHTPSRQTYALAHFTVPQRLGVDHTQRFIFNNTRFVETAESYVVYERGSQLTLHVMPVPNGDGNVYVDASGWAFSEKALISLVRESKLKQLR